MLVKIDRSKCDSDGKLMQTGSFVDEKKSGIWMRYHTQGSLYDEGRFVDNQKVGEWRVNDAKGRLVKTDRHKFAT
jgi:antitoxin component YwqK of YwqJK toxin-antitoxin module